MSARFRVWTLRGAFWGLLLTLLWTAVPAAQRNEVSPAIRLAISDAVGARDAAIHNMAVDIAVVKRTAEQVREEQTEVRRAMWGIASALLLSLLTQIHQARKSKNGS